VLQTLDCLILCNFKLSIVQSNLTDVSYCGHIIDSTTLCLFKKFLHESLHFAAFQSVLYFPFCSVFSIFVCQQLIRQISKTIGA
jgi:hypothetical protein